MEGSQTDRNTLKSDEDENDTFETIAPEKDNPVRRELENYTPWTCTIKFSYQLNTYLSLEKN